MERSREVVYEREYDLPLELVWRTLSDTERLNVAAGSGFAPYIAEDEEQPDGSVIRRASKDMGFFTWRWREGFGEWVEGRFFRHARQFENGPFKELTLTLRFAPTATGVQARFEFFAHWSSYLGDLLVATGFLKKITRPVVDAADSLIAEASAPAPVSTPGLKDQTAQRRLADAVADLEAGDYGAGLAGRLADYLAAADPHRLKRIRPLALAKAWGAAGDAVSSLFVAAHKAGLLAMRWEVLCPRCRGGKSQSLLLSDMPRRVHCASCNIDYDRDFSRNVELVFSPPQWLRALPEGDFCLMSPETTRHVKLQCDLAPGEVRTEAADLPDGRYRIRTLEAGGEREADLHGGAVPEVRIQGEDVSVGELGVPGFVRMANLGDSPRSIVIEDVAWGQDALTGDKVIAMPAFREHCPEQLLRPGDDVEIDRVAILFTDLKGSTALYEAVGDSRAYALVRAHFEFLQEQVRRHQGVVVKTIGDAVMAAFVDGDAAMAAALDIQAGVVDFNRSQETSAIELKVGLHEGPCIAIVADGALDYFGATVNMAARLQGQADGGDIVISRAIAGHPTAAAAIARAGGAWEEAHLAGFDAPTPFSRIGNAAGV